MARCRDPGTPRTAPPRRAARGPGGLGPRRLGQERHAAHGNRGGFGGGPGPTRVSDRDGRTTGHRRQPASVEEGVSVGTATARTAVGTSISPAGCRSDGCCLLGGTGRRSVHQSAVRAQFMAHSASLAWSAAARASRRKTPFRTTPRASRLTVQVNHRAISYSGPTGCQPAVHLHKRAFVQVSATRRRQRITFICRVFRRGRRVAPRHAEATVRAVSRTECGTARLLRTGGGRSAGNAPPAGLDSESSDSTHRVWRHAARLAVEPAGNGSVGQVSPGAR